jgi:hypothetical protein
MFSSSVCITSIVRLSTLTHFGLTTDPTFSNSATTFWTTLETTMAIICACLPSIRAGLLRAFPETFGSGSFYSSIQKTIHSRGASTNHQPSLSFTKNPHGLGHSVSVTANGKGSRWPLQKPSFSTANSKDEEIGLPLQQLDGDDEKKSVDGIMKRVELTRMESARLVNERYEMVERPRVYVQRRSFD